MNEILHLLLAFTGGLLLGGLFFGGLWLTVKKSVAANQPALLIAGSFFMRTAIALAGFYYIANGDWQRMVLCLLGFITARLTVLWLTRSIGKSGRAIKKEAGHET